VRTTPQIVSYCDSHRDLLAGCCVLVGELGADVFQPLELGLFRGEDDTHRPHAVGIVPAIAPASRGVATEGFCRNAMRVGDLLAAVVLLDHLVRVEDRGCPEYLLVRQEADLTARRWDLRVVSRILPVPPGCGALLGRLCPQRCGRGVSSKRD
jgi:hypothetical protein